MQMISLIYFQGIKTLLLKPAVWSVCFLFLAVRATTKTLPTCFWHHGLHFTPSCCSQLFCHSGSPLSSIKLIIAVKMNCYCCTRAGLLKTLLYCNIQIYSHSDLLQAVTGSIEYGLNSFGKGIQVMNNHLCLKVLQVLMFDFPYTKIRINNKHIKSWDFNWLKPSFYLI